MTEPTDPAARRDTTAPDSPPQATGGPPRPAMSNKSKRSQPKDNYWGEVVSIRAHPTAKDALTMAKARLRSSPTLRFRGKRVTEEVIFGALCLWAAVEDPADLEAALAPHVARLEELVGGAAEEGSEG